MEGISKLNTDSTTASLLLAISTNSELNLKTHLLIHSVVQSNAMDESEAIKKEPKGMASGMVGSSSR